MGKPAASTPTSVVRRRGFGFAANRRNRAGTRTGAATNSKAAERAAMYNRKWLEKNDKEKTPFSEEVLSTTFGKENVEKLIAACKTATDSEVNESNRLLTDDYIYSVQITSHRAPHVPVHLSRM